jgi:hypothetical protein
MSKQVRAQGALLVPEILRGHFVTGGVVDVLPDLSPVHSTRSVSRSHPTNLLLVTATKTACRLQKNAPLPGALRTPHPLSFCMSAHCRKHFATALEPSRLYSCKGAYVCPVRRSCRCSLTVRSLTKSRCSGGRRACSSACAKKGAPHGDRGASVPH